MLQQRDFWEMVWSESPDGASSNFGYGLVRDFDLETLHHKVVVDIGCGNFTYSRIPEIASRFYGVDISHTALVDGKPYLERGHLIQASAFALPLATQSVDFAVSVEVLPLLGEDYVNALREMARVSAEGILFTVNHVEAISQRSAKSMDLTYGQLFKGTMIDVVALTEIDVRAVIGELGLSIDGLVVFTRDEVMNYGVPFHQQRVYSGGDLKEAMYVKAVHRNPPLHPKI